MARRPRAQLRFSLLADFEPHDGVARHYGVYRDGQGWSARAHFVVDQQRLIRFSWADPDVLNLGVDALVTALEWLGAEPHEPRRDKQTTALKCAATRHGCLGHQEGRKETTMALSDSGPPGAATAVEWPASAADARLRVTPTVPRLLREREAARAQAADLARDNQRLEAFLGLASHELRGPVLSSSLGVQLAAQRVDLLCKQAAQFDATLTRRLTAVQDSLTTAASSLERLTRLVSDLLDLSHIKASHLGQLRGQLAPADLLAIVRAAVDEQRQLAPTRRIRLHLPTPRQGVQAVPVWADADRIDQVLTNLLTNALKYAPADRPVDVQVRVRQRQGWAWVSVRDQGPGLPLGEQTRIWEAFHRADGIAVTGGTPHASAQSLGLGLYVCKTIIEHHQGKVGIHSTPAKGSTFWFTLPVRPVVAGVRTEEEEARQPANEVA